MKDFIIPAIDIKNGSVVRLKEGKFEDIKVYKKDPVEQFELFVELGFKRIHIVDLDGAQSGVPKNLKLLENMLKQKNKAKVEIGGGIRSLETAKALFDIGVDYIIVGTMAVKNKEEFMRLLEIYENKVILSVDAKNGKVAIGGWEEQSSLSPCDMAKLYNDYPIESYLYTNINIDGMLSGIDINPYKEFKKCTQKPIIASGGVASLEDVMKLKPLVNGVVVGKAIYENTIDIYSL
ncbi:MAG: 1-(5-phosphoribosyl)-5-[(5-phosphoribosylamino)methylideneamino]imidazole-4-carboxamide isomerase [Hydrogenobaculum sp.]|nr:MAG: 1-(5-phosphoribosyl)-5-[(5-phosphoribosylamino)methylideneamino]imidazole-4-carboxamide isomerase [Hydrogenobaculum sp.]